MTTEQSNQLNFIYQNITNSVLTLTSTPIITKKHTTHESYTSNGTSYTYTAPQEGYLAIINYNTGDNGTTTSISVASGTPTVLSEAVSVSWLKIFLYYVKPKDSFNTSNWSYAQQAFGSGYCFVLFPVGSSS